jgi:hypothetical protein
MKMTRVISTAMLFLLPGAIAIAYAQEHGEAKPAEHEQQAKPAKQQAKPAQHQQAQQKTAAKPAQHAASTEKAKPEQQHAASTPKAQPAEKSQRAARTPQAKPAEQQQRGQQASRGGGQTAGGHGSIPEARYNASFGSSHTFHVDRSSFANGSGRFQYGGYWFNAANPWPVGWLYTDAVYVAYLNGGYFLCNPFHPGVYISINIG